MLICCRTLNSIRGSILVTHRAEVPSTTKDAIYFLIEGMGSASNFLYTAVPTQLNSYTHFRLEYQDPSLCDKLPPWKPPFFLLLNMQKKERKKSQVAENAQYSVSLATLMTSRVSRKKILSAPQFLGSNADSHYWKKVS